MDSEKDFQYRPKALPLWLRRLKDVKEEVYSEIVPQSFEERLSQGLALMAHGLNSLRESIRQKFPKASEARINKEISLHLVRLSQIDAQWVNRWKKEREELFRK